MDLHKLLMRDAVNGHVGVETILHSRWSDEAGKRGFGKTHRYWGEKNGATSDNEGGKKLLTVA